MAKSLYYWPVHLKTHNGLVVIDNLGTLYYLSLGRWTTLVDILKRDFRQAKGDVRLVAGTKQLESKEIAATRAKIEQMLDHPNQIDQLRDLLLYEFIFGTSLQRKVWEYLVERLPVLTTTTYSQIAKDLEIKSPRVVGNACGANRIALVVPCHRVLTALGTITGYRWGTSLKDQLLQMEKQGLDHGKKKSN